jgi:hypothetical protein
MEVTNLNIRKLSNELYLISILFISGCSLTPVHIDDNKIYIGVFYVDKDKNPGVNCRYKFIQGAGICIGPRVLGLGYFEHESLIVNTDIDITCNSPIADVTINKALKLN